MKISLNINKISMIKLQKAEPMQNFLGYKYAMY